MGRHRDRRAVHARRSRSAATSTAATSPRPGGSPTRRWPAPPSARAAGCCSRRSRACWSPRAGYEEALATLDAAPRPVRHPEPGLEPVAADHGRRAAAGSAAPTRRSRWSRRRSRCCAGGARRATSGRLCACSAGCAGRTASSDLREAVELLAPTTAGVELARAQVRPRRRAAACPTTRRSPLLRGRGRRARTASGPQAIALRAGAALQAARARRRPAAGRRPAAVEHRTADARPGGHGPRRPRGGPTAVHDAGHRAGRAGGCRGERVSSPSQVGRGMLGPGEEECRDAAAGADAARGRAESLRGLCGGSVHLPGDPSYDMARSPWNIQALRPPGGGGLPRLP